MLRGPLEFVKLEQILRIYVHFITNCVPNGYGPAEAIETAEDV